MEASHAKVMLAPPRLNLRRAASYNRELDRLAVPLSATSSRFNFNHLFFSPPPSPSLPVLVNRPRRSPSQIIASRPSRVFRYLFLLATLIATVGFLGRRLWTHDLYLSNPTTWPYFGGNKHNNNEDDVGFKMVGQDALPDFPTPIATNRGHKTKWTVSIPPYYDFPLSVEEYQSMGSRCREVSAHARELHGKAPQSETDWSIHRDPLYLDISEAESAGLLVHGPARVNNKRAQMTGRFVGLDWESMAGLPVCKKSLTYVLESPDAGLGGAVMNMWMLYGLAKQQGRAFFVDDSRWAYGTYASIFEPPPVPDCRPPPRHHMVPCPAQARHLVVSGVTLRDVLPALMAEHHKAIGSKSALRHLYSLAREGHDALFRVNSDDAKYIALRVRQLRDRAKQAGGAPVIGLHIRHGDQHPLEFQYHDTYIPSDVFLDKANHLTEVHRNATGKPLTMGNDDDDDDDLQTFTVVASDDPSVFNQPEFSASLRAQERIFLSVKEAKPETKQDPLVLHPFTEEEFGWEGGFFAPMFWNLGLDRKNNASPKGSAKGGIVRREQAGEMALKLRSFMGRAYMMDLAVLAAASDYVVCGVNAMGCRMLGVMMGWEGVEGGRWVNVDGDHEWGWISW
ncbi:hypothetical protein ESCO_004754 [Escovopsis weberi]|uniref:Uncharacterized protein n=1 Tax=Escovopsis weberi TaxID=150374 RepID=A0A0M8MZU6_ESCWE|nr:hypothetical protein ESCO_004754 [Escovopsis weberi]